MYKINPTSQELKLDPSSGAPQSGPQRDGSPAPAGAPATKYFNVAEDLLRALWPCETLAMTVRDHLTAIKSGAYILPAGPLRLALLSIIKQYNDGDVGRRLEQIQATFDNINGEG